MPRVTAVVVHWQDLADTRGCVKSLAGEPGVEVIVVDNGSREPVGTALGPGVAVLHSAENRGYAGGANLGIRAALARGADVVLLLNNDARVRRGATAAAVAIITSSDNSARKSRTFAGNMVTTTSMRICRPSQATAQQPVNTQPTMRKSMISSAHGIDTLKK